MLKPIVAKAFHDRWKATAIATSVIGCWLVLAMAIYRDIDTAVYTELPAGIRELMGIPAGADAATLAYNVMLDFAAPLTLASLAISMGAAAIAGEERSGTIAVLLANPVSRRSVIASKLAAMIVLIATASLVWWALARLAPWLLGIEVGSTHIAAVSVHIALIALFYGMVAFSIGAWTGNRSAASSDSAALLAISYVGVALLGLVDSISGLAQLLPWYYLSAAQPLVNGVDFGHLAVLATGAVVLGVVGFVGVERRDLRQPSTTVSVLDRVRDSQRLGDVFERLAGTARVSRIWVKTTSEYQGLVVMSAAVMFLVMGVLMGPMFLAIETQIGDLGQDLPAAVMALAGNGDLSTPEGWFQVETFSLMAPIAVMVVTIVVAVGSLASEQANQTMGLLLANPIRRSRLVLETALAMSVYALAVGAATGAGVAVANRLSGLEMSNAAIASAALLTTLLGLLFGAIALLLSAWTGRAKTATYITIGLALSSHLLNSFLPLTERLSSWVRLSPHHYMLGSDPLNNGLDWSHAGVLTVMVIVVLAGATVGFDRRDIHY